MGLIDRFKNAWNAFINVNKNNQNIPTYINLGYSSSSRPDKPYISVSNERSIVTAICNRIAIDASLQKLFIQRLIKKEMSVLLKLSMTN